MGEKWEKMPGAAASGIRTGIRCAFHARGTPSTRALFGSCSHNNIDAQSRFTFRRSVRGSGGEGVDEGMHTEFQRCCRAARAAPRIQPPSGSIYSLGRRAGPRFRGSCHKTLRLPTATRRVRSTPRDVNRRRLQNEPCFGVDRRKVNRFPFRRTSCPLARVSCFGTAFGL